MKYKLLLVIIASLFLFTCNNDDDDNDEPTTSELIIGTWEVSKYKVEFTQDLKYKYYLEGTQVENGTYTVTDNKIYLKAGYSSYGCSTTATDQYYKASASETSLTLTAGNDPCSYRKLCLDGKTFEKQ